MPGYTIQSRTSTTPALVREAARQAGVQARGWFLQTQRAADHASAAFFLLTEEGHADLVVKFSRLVGDRRKTGPEIRGLEAARAAGAVVFAHAPRLVTEFELSGHHAVVQTAVLGPTAARIAGTWGLGSRSRKLEHIEAIVEWLFEVARVTAHRRTSVREDVRDAIVSRWRGGEVERLIETAATAPAVFQHGDLADENVIVDGDGFIAVDWEWARDDGFPLWDLLSLAVTALPLVEGAAGDDDRVRRLRDLFHGRARSSMLLFDWLRRAAVASGLDMALVPQIVTLWFLSCSQRPDGWPALERFAAEWLADPELGVSWSFWPRSCE
jgi:hypothetical protein